MTALELARELMTLAQKHGDVYVFFPEPDDYADEQEIAGVGFREAEGGDSWVSMCCLSPINTNDPDYDTCPKCGDICDDAGDLPDRITLKV